VRALEGVVRRLLGVGERERALGDEGFAELPGLRRQLPRLIDRVHEAALERLGSVDGATRVDQLLRVPERRRPREADAPAPAREDAEIDLGLADLRGRGREAQVAGQRQLEAPTQGVTVDRGDCRLRHRLKQLTAGVPELAPAPGLQDPEPLHVLDVGSCDEGLVSGSGEDDDPCLFLAGKPF
jgi:hypothetical protein